MARKMAGVDVGKDVGKDGRVVAMVVIDSILTLWSHVGGDMRLDREVADCEGVGYHMVMDV